MLMKKMNQMRFALLVHQKMMMPSSVDCRLLLELIVGVARLPVAAEMLVYMAPELTVVLVELTYRQSLQLNFPDSLLVIQVFGFDIVNSPAQLNNEIKI